MDKVGFMKGLKEWHESRFPTTVGLRKVGQEKEYPVVWANDYQAADVRILFPILIEKGWEPKYDEVYNNLILGVMEPITGVEVTTEAGWCTLEIIMPPEESIIDSTLKLQKVEKMIVSLARDQGMLVLGYGIQPISLPEPRLWIKKRRHEKIREVLPEGVNIVTITASDQVHVDITRDEVVDAVNVFNALSGLIIHLFANSPIWQGGVDPLYRLAVREDLWSFASPDRIGMPLIPYNNLEDYLKATGLLKQFLTRENGDYSTTEALYLDYMLKSPKTDWKYHWMLLEGMTWLNARVRTPYSTIEVRPACTASLDGTEALTALCLGIVENLTEVKEMVFEYPWSFWQGKRGRAIAGVQDDIMDSLADRMLMLAEKGLKNRCYGEESLLGLLYDRLYLKTNPAKKALKVFEQEGFDSFIKTISL